MTEIQPLRKNGQGIQGTFQNIDHHAPKLEHLVKTLNNEAPSWGFKLWKQGHNTHVFETQDERTFILRPYSERGEGYVGVRLYARHSRSVEIPVLTFFYDCRNQLSIWDFSNLMKKVAEVQPFSSTDPRSRDCTE